MHEINKKRNKSKKNERAGLQATTLFFRGKKTLLEQCWQWPWVDLCKACNITPGGRMMIAANMKMRQSKTKHTHYRKENTQELTQASLMYCVLFASMFRASQPKMMMEKKYHFSHNIPKKYFAFTVSIQKNEGKWTRQWVPSPMAEEPKSSNAVPGRATKGRQRFALQNDSSLSDVECAVSGIMHAGKPPAVLSNDEFDF